MTGAQQRVAALVRRWCNPLTCGVYVDWEFDGGKMVAAKCKCGHWVRF